MSGASEPTAREQIRLAAVALAADLDETCDDDPADEHRRTDQHRIEHILRIAERIYAWATEPAPVARLVGRIGPLVPIPEGPPAMANPQVPVTYQFPITIEPEDSQGNAVGDTLTWTSSDPADAPVTADTTTLIGTVQVLNPAVDITVTATDGTNSYEFTFDAAVDAPVTLVGTVGVPTKIPATPAA